MELFKSSFKDNELDTDDPELNERLMSPLYSYQINLVDNTPIFKELNKRVKVPD